MEEIECDRIGCNNLAIRHSEAFGNICNDCFERLLHYCCVYGSDNDLISRFMQNQIDELEFEYMPEERYSRDTTQAELESIFNEIPEVNVTCRSGCGQYIPEHMGLDSIEKSTDLNELYLEYGY